MPNPLGLSGEPTLFIIVHCHQPGKSADPQYRPMHIIEATLKLVPPLSAFLITLRYFTMTFLIRPSAYLAMYIPLASLSTFLPSIV